MTTLLKNPDILFLNMTVEEVLPMEMLITVWNGAVKFGR
jgi:hypothetical protein